MAAIMWPAALVGVASVIDNPWSVCTQRTEAAGKQLAEVLLERTQVGYIVNIKIISTKLPYVITLVWIHVERATLKRNAYSNPKWSKQ